jgi:hypothetical protein
MIPIARNKPIRLKLDAESFHLWRQRWAWGDSSASSSMARMIAHTSALSLQGSMRIQSGPAAGPDR